MRKGTDQIICVSNIDTGFHEVLSNERTSGYIREHNQLKGWSSDENDWNEELYPVWKRGDPRWKNSWKGKSKDSMQTALISYLSLFPRF